MSAFVTLSHKKTAPSFNVCRNKLSTWISQCAESKYAKSGGTATRLRDEGNAKFRIHDNDGAIRLYTESIITAPELSPELSLGYGNRSAALYHAGQYEDCLQVRIYAPLDTCFYALFECCSFV